MILLVALASADVVLAQSSANFEFDYAGVTTGSEFSSSSGYQMQAGPTPIETNSESSNYEIVTVNYIPAASPGPVCGNGIIEAGEVCDGADFGGVTCLSYGFNSGSLSCTGGCAVIDSSACFNTGGGGGGGGGVLLEDDDEEEEEMITEEEVEDAFTFGEMLMEFFEGLIEPEEPPVVPPTVPPVVTPPAAQPEVEPEVAPTPEVEVPSEGVLPPVPEEAKEPIIEAIEEAFESPDEVLEAIEDALEIIGEVAVTEEEAIEELKELLEKSDETKESLEKALEALKSVPEAPEKVVEALESVLEVLSEVPAAPLDYHFEDYKKTDVIKVIDQTPVVTDTFEEDSTYNVVVKNIAGTTVAEQEVTTNGDGVLVFESENVLSYGNYSVVVYDDKQKQVYDYEIKIFFNGYKDFRIVTFGDKDEVITDFETVIELGDINHGWNEMITGEGTPLAKIFAYFESEVYVVETFVDLYGNFEIEIPDCLEGGRHKVRIVQVYPDNTISKSVSYTFTLIPENFVPKIFCYIECLYFLLFLIFVAGFTIILRKYIKCNHEKKRKVKTKKKTKK